MLLFFKSADQRRRKKVKLQCAPPKKLESPLVGGWRGVGGLYEQKTRGIGSIKFEDRVTVASVDDELAYSMKWDHYSTMKIESFENVLYYVAFMFNFSFLCGFESSCAKNICTENPI